MWQKKHTQVAGSHLLNRRYFHSSSGSFNSASLFIRHHHPPFQVTAEGSGPYEEGRLAKPGHGPVSRGQTGGPDQEGEKNSVSNNLSTCHKRTTKKSSPTSLEFPGYRVAFTALTDKLLIPFGRYFQRTSFAAANVTRAAIKSTKGALENEKRGGNVAATSENPVE